MTGQMEERFTLAVGVHHDCSITDLMPCVVNICVLSSLQSDLSLRVSEIWVFYIIYSIFGNFTSSTEILSHTSHTSHFRQIRMHETSLNHPFKDNVKFKINKNKNKFSFNFLKDTSDRDTGEGRSRWDSNSCQGARPI